MNTMICATCGCSLIRLGINNEQAVKFEYNQILYVFCCQGCLALFKQSPTALLKETMDIVVCPTCLAEKRNKIMLSVLINDQTLHFCRCPYCFDTFKENPQYYIDRLEGRTGFKGLFVDDEKACCH